MIDASDDEDGDHPMGTRKKPLNINKHEGNQIKEDDLTPIRLEEVWAFDWVRLCKAAQHPFSDLKYIILPNIAETHTLAVLKELKEDEIHEYGPWPGTKFLLDGNEPYVGTRLGVSVAKLIVQRHELFGPQRTLVGGQIWWTPSPPGSPQRHSGDLSMMWVLDDPPRDLVQKQRNALPNMGPSWPIGQRGGRRGH